MSQQQKLSNKRISKMSQIDWKNALPETIVCYCANVDKQTIVSAIEAGATTLKQIQQETSACTSNRCKELNPAGTCCHKDIGELIKVYKTQV
jgi:NAD(P)H-nitrite reductase large subunit